MESLELPVLYKREELMLTARIHRFGYSYKLLVNADGLEVTFEKDNAGEFRAIVEQSEHMKADMDLIKAIVDTLNSMA